MYDPQLSHSITTAILRLQTEMEQAAPFMAGRVSNWMRELSGTAQPEDYFKHPLAFPSLLLPWWLEQTLQPEPDLSFQTELVYSTINGYYYIRLIDNLMDGQATVEFKLLPATAFFHTQFQAVYQRYFAANHSFWNFFSTHWFSSAEAAMKDASLADIDETQFRQVAAKKVCAGKIPLAAVCCRHERPDLIEPWSHFFDLLGCWHQMFNDLFDWHTDLERQNRTYFLSEAERRKDPDEPIAAWVVREGFEWGIETLQTWMVELRAMAPQLQNPNLAAYLNQREIMLLKQKEEVAEGLRSLGQILRAI
jgi:hypothetical protein